MSNEKKVRVSEEVLLILGAQPKEELLAVAHKSDKLFIGVPKEDTFQENRVALTVPGTELLVNNGHRVLVESLAGEKASYSDKAYTEAGAEVVSSHKEVFKANIILKVAPPTKDDLELLRPGQTIISPLHLPTFKDDILKMLMQKKVTALAFEYIKDRSGSYPIVHSMSEIAGNASILIAAELLSKAHNGNGLLLGGITGIPPANVVILGAGTVGECAARASLGLGADVKVFDNSIYKLRRLQSSVGSRVYTSIFQPDILTQVLQETDVAIGAIHSGSGRTPVVVSERMVSQMKPGSVIIDVSIDQGGCFETSIITSHDRPFVKKFGVIHYGVPNIPSRVSHTASIAISNVLAPALVEAGDLGGIEKYLSYNTGMLHGVYLYKGILTNQHLGERFDLKHTSIDLLLGSF